MNIDPTVPVPEWGLSDIGRQRVEALKGALGSTKTIVSSTETKAVETASIISKFLDVPITIIAETGEIDRSIAGYMKSDEFNQTRRAFFAEPNMSAQGWETARAAQTRIVKACAHIIADHYLGDILIVGHGGVGTLLYCHFAKIPISVEQDQPDGGGNYFAVDLEKMQPTHKWRPIEMLKNMSSRKEQ